ncbi:predicted protein [Streptomyces filamentosus NRRL 15998]|uniref:Predicted protein n=1 Tax=Streptomyces filamentosus NRRL 15998 TaxID=457431 RepID=D6AGY4_STRFL|nr:predicted protein [Streptomyces filamentosus NRRL 15998]
MLSSVDEKPLLLAERAEVARGSGARRDGHGGDRTLRLAIRAGKVLCCWRNGRGTARHRMSSECFSRGGHLEG